MSNELDWGVGVGDVRSENARMYKLDHLTESITPSLDTEHYCHLIMGLFSAELLVLMQL